MSLTIESGEKAGFLAVVVTKMVLFLGSSFRGASETSEPGYFEIPGLVCGPSRNDIERVTPPASARRLSIDSRVCSMLPSDTASRR